MELVNQRLSKPFRFTFIILFFLFIATSLHAQTATAPSTGDGTSSNPYPISTLDNLYWLSQNSSYWSKYFIQTADIDASETATWDSGSGFSPIGNSTINFTGHYNGREHTIDGLHINRTSTNYVGLFGYISSAGTVDSIAVSNSIINGQNYVGALAGINQGTVKFCSAPEDSVCGSQLVGGLISWNESGTISLCYSSGTVTGTSSNIAYGGLIGWNHEGTITNCYSTSTVTASSGSRVGGLVGFLYSGTATNCYTTGSVTGSSSVGALIGMGGGTATNCFYNSDVFTGTTSYGTSKTTAQMTTESTYTNAGWDFDGETTNGSNNYWTRNDSYNDGYPYLVNQPSLLLIKTQPITNYTGTAATANGTIANLGSSAVTAHGFCWSSTDSIPTIASSKVNLGTTSQTGSFTASLTSLTAGTVYYIRAYATNSSRTFYGEVVSNVPAVTTLSTDTITVTTAVFHGTITSSAGGSITAHGFCWSSTNTSPTITSDSSVDLGFTSNTGSFRAAISNLSGATTYYVRAYAENSTGISYGESISFFTQFVGSGTSSDPYQIPTLRSLKILSENSGYWNKYFIQTADIDADTTKYWNSGSGFSPIGNSSTKFTGSYNGEGHIISGLTIDRSGSDYVALFGYIQQATIDSLGIKNATIKGYRYVGSLVGYNFYYSTVNNCYSTGSVSGTWQVGGLIGNNNEVTVSNCYARNSVSGNDFTGGLVGWSSSSTITNCYSTGTITCTSYSCSSSHGFLGYNDASTVTNCFYDATTSGSSDSDATGKTTALMKTESTFTDAGWDFIGETTNGTNDYWGINSVDNDGYPCFAGQLTSPTVNTQPITDYTGTTTTANGTIAGLGISEITAHGFCWSSTNTTPTIADSKVDLGTISQTGSFSSSVTGLTTGTVYYIRAYATNFSGTSYGRVVTNVPTVTTLSADSITGTTAVFHGTITASAGGSITAHGFCWSSTNLVPTIVDSYVDLGTAFDTGSFRAAISNLSGVTTYYVRGYVENSTGISYGDSISFFTLAGSGTSSDPYQIATLADLKWLSGKSAYWNKYFVQTVDIDASEIKSWDSGKGFSPIGNSSTIFTGCYNGKGHVINGLYINRASENIGFFGYAEQGSIDSLGLTNCTMSGNYDVGGLVGVCGSTISNCYCTGTISGSSIVGGLIGYGTSYISECYSVCSVSGEYSGGFIGVLDGSTISNCYSTGSVSGTAGFIGGGSSCQINNCYSTGAASDYGFGMDFGNLSVNNCFYNSETSGVSDSYATGLTTTAMKKQASFNSWDFTNTWGIRADSTYPALRGVNNAPFAFADTINISALSINIAALLNNDYDYETLQANLVANIRSITGGTLSSEYISFQNTASYGDKISVTYRIGEIFSNTGDTLWGNTATSYIIYNTPPEITSVRDTTTAEDTPVTLAIGMVSATDADGDNLSLVVYGGSNYSFSGTTVTPDENFNGILYVPVAVTDGIDTSNIDTVNITVTAVNDAPVAADSSVTTTQGTAIAVVLNATDIDGTIESIVIDSYPANGNVEISGTTLTYTPDDNFVGDDTLIWYALDNSGANSNTATLIIKVVPAILSNLVVSDTTVTAGNESCFDATNEIAVSTVTVDNNASASFIAGSSINFLPGFHAVAGSYVHAWITEDGSFCEVVTAVSSVVCQPEIKSAEVDEQGEIPGIGEEVTMKVYPNPNNGQFKVAISGATEELSEIGVYNLLGEKVYSGKINNGEVNGISLGNVSQGLYVIKVVSWEKKFVYKIIIQ